MRMKMVLAMAILAVLLVIIIPISVYAKRVVDANRKVRAGSVFWTRAARSTDRHDPQNPPTRDPTEQVDDDAVRPARWWELTLSSPSSSTSNLCVFPHPPVRRRSRLTETRGFVPRRPHNRKHE